jgi:hypothetical protein
MRKREIQNRMKVPEQMVKLTMDQIDSIVVSELQFALEVAIVPNRDEGGYDLGIDEDLVEALTVTLKYFMDANSYQNYMNYVTNLTIR